MTVVNPPARYGAVVHEFGLVREFKEKHASQNAFVNGGFFVFEPVQFVSSPA